MKKLWKYAFKGFTLIEILIVVCILSVLLGIVVIAVNPGEQLRRTNDVSMKAVTKDFLSSVKYYYTQKQTEPWVKSTSCRDQLSKPATVSDLSSCLSELTDATQLQTKYSTTDEAKYVHVTECAGAIAVCYDPLSKAFNTAGEAKYTRDGALQPGCPGSDSCYACSFSTNDAEECFSALNPNGNLAIVPSPQPNQVVPIPVRNSKHACDEPSTDGGFSCMADIVTNTAGTPLTSLALPAGIGPEQLHTAYNLPCTPGGAVNATCTTPPSYGPKTIAIVIAYHSPTLESDLIGYSTTYNLPPCTKANGCLTVVNQNGQTSPLPATISPDWALEEALDVQMVHAVCQTCQIIVVEANSNYITDLGPAVNRAATMGAHAISTSWGSSEFSTQSNYDQYFNHPGIFLTASSGDYGYGNLFPSSSSNVISVGGTTLSLYANNTYYSESVWRGAGSGCSTYEVANSFQSALSNWNLTGCGVRRGATDVSAVADPSTGVAVLNTTSYGGRTGWWIVGGTSASSPIVSAALAMDGTAPAGVSSAAYIYQNPSKFRDVKTGSNGGCGGVMCNGGVGYDGPTGLGSPNMLASANNSPEPVQTPTITPTPTVAPTPTPNPVSPQVWVATYWKIYRYNTDGTMAANPIEKPVSSLAVVGQEVWVSDPMTNSISRYNFDGNLVTKPTLTGNGLNRPHRLTVVGSQVWVANTDGASPANTISRFNFDGSSAGSPLTGNGLCMPSYFAIVGNQVWVTNYNYPQPPCGSSGASTISRFNFDGSSAGTVISGNGMNFSNGIAVVGQEVWVTNTFQNRTISRFTFDGTPAGSQITGNGLDRPTPIAVVGNQVWVGNDPLDKSYTISRFNFNGTSGGSAITYPSINNVNGPTDIVVIPGSSSTVLPTSTPTPTPTPVPTAVPVTCATIQTVTLAQSNPILALPGDTVTNSLNITNNDPTSCSALFTISTSSPTSFTLSGVPASITVAGGQTKTINFTLTVPSNATAGNYVYQFWAAKPGQSSVNPVNGSIQVQQVGPTPTPTPTPISCTQPWTNSLGSTSMSGNAGDTLNQTLYIKNNNPVGCGGGTFGISHSYPTGWIINNLPPSVQLSGGQSITIPFTITISTGAQVQDYTLQYWINSGSLPLNATAHVLKTALPPTGQFFSNMSAKMYSNYATFEYSYNATGNVSGRLDVATDPNALNQITNPPATAYYGFAFNSGSAWDASNTSTPTSVHGFIVSNPQYFSGWKCGATIYYRMYNDGDKSIKSTVQSGTVDCTTVIDVLPWGPWYSAIYYGVYDSRYDVDKNGVVNWTDYWILVRETRLR